MIVIDVNGTKIEAETLETAAKLAKKEEKRQEKERVANNERHQKALLQCYASIGKLASTTIRQEDIALGDIINGLISEENGIRKLYVESLNGQSNSVSLLPTETILALYIPPSGMLAAKIQQKDYSPTWSVFGVEDSYVTSIILPHILADALEPFLTHQEEKQAA